MFFRPRDRVLAVIIFSSLLASCSGGGTASVAPPVSDSVSVGHGTSGTARHGKAQSQASGSSDCGTCSCSGTADNSTTTQDQGDPCQGSIPSATASSVDNSGPIVDTGFNVWVQPPQPDCVADPTNSACQVAVTNSVPSGKCTQSDGADSLPVGATLGSVNKNGVVTARSVIDINQVNALATQTVPNNQTVVNNYVSIGWMYLDNNGGLWFQKDQLSQWTFTINGNVNAYFGLSATRPIGQNPVYIKSPPTSTPIADSLQTVKCVTKGRAFVPGTLGVPPVNT